MTSFGEVYSDGSCIGFAVSARLRLLTTSSFIQCRSVQRDNAMMLHRIMRLKGGLHRLVSAMLAADGSRVDTWRVPFYELRHNSPVFIRVP